jgi:hypothetical protein
MGDRAEPLVQVAVPAAGLVADAERPGHAAADLRQQLGPVPLDVERLDHLPMAIENAHRRPPLMHVDADVMHRRRCRR